MEQLALSSPLISDAANSEQSPPVWSQGTRRCWGHAVPGGARVSASTGDTSATRDCPVLAAAPRTPP